MCGARRLQKLAAAWIFFLFFFYILLQITMAQGEQELVHVEAEDPYPSPMNGGVGVAEEQRLSGVGSRPPCCACERRCGVCAPCTAAQVRAAGRVGVGVGVGTECADYEPVRWKCKCGDAVFDP